MIRCIFIISFFLIISPSWSQLDEMKFARWHVRAGAGAAVVLSPRYSDPADYLIEMGDGGFLTGPFSVRYFVNSEWGAEVQLNKVHPFGGADFREKFYKALAERFAPNYFVQSTDYDNSFIQGNKSQITIGLVHQSRKGRWLFHQYIGAGNRNVHVFSAKAILKENGANNYLLYTQQPSKRLVSGVVLSGSAGVSYMVRDRMMIQFETIVSRFDQDFSFYEEITDLFTLETSGRRIEYTRAFHQIFLSIGFTYIIDPDPIIPHSAQRKMKGKSN